MIEETLARLATAPYDPDDQSKEQQFLIKTSKSIADIVGHLKDKTCYDFNYVEKVLGHINDIFLNNDLSQYSECLIAAIFANYSAKYDRCKATLTSVSAALKTYDQFNLAVDASVVSQAIINLGYLDISPSKISNDEFGKEITNVIFAAQMLAQSSTWEDHARFAKAQQDEIFRLAKAADIEVIPDELYERRRKQLEHNLKDIKANTYISSESKDGIKKFYEHEQLLTQDGVEIDAWTDEINQPRETGLKEAV